MASAAADAAAAAPAAPASKPLGSQFSTDLLAQYYQRLFPGQLLYQWLSYGNSSQAAAEDSTIVKDYFPRREICFTLEDDIYIRYQSFEDGDEFTAEVRRRMPHKIDIGAVYTHPPKDHTQFANSFKPLERELVFDIDLTDYDAVGAAGADISRGMGKECWYFMAAAIKVVDAALRRDFGFKHLLWIFSGRRGIHCWVCDPSALKLDDNARKAIVQYLSVVTGAEGPDASAPLTLPEHPLVSRCMDDLEEMFMKHVARATGQGLLVDGNEAGWRQIVQTIPDDSVQERLLHAWSGASMTAEQRWAQLKLTTEAEAKALVRKSQNNKKAQEAAKHLLQSPKSIVCLFVYPRLDINVSTHRNHLLKSPWCVHPKTGRICVPLDPETVDDFDPHTVPTLVSVFQELDDYSSGDQAQDASAGEQPSAKKKRRVEDAFKTSMGPYLAYFQDQFLTPLMEAHSTDRRGVTPVAEEANLEAKMELEEA